jgi:hypothetical protein
VDGLPAMTWLPLDCHTNRSVVTSYPLLDILPPDILPHVSGGIDSEGLVSLSQSHWTEVKPESSGCTSVPVHCLHLRASLSYLSETSTTSCSTRPVIQVMGSLVSSKFCVADGYIITSGNDWIIGPLRGS